MLRGDGHAQWNEENAIIMRYQSLLLDNSRHSAITCNTPAAKVESATPTASIEAGYLIKSLSYCSLLKLLLWYTGIRRSSKLWNIVSVVSGTPVLLIRNAVRVSRPGRPQQHAQ
jgi:hypothetical protein